jgi:hypothetical protein
MINENGQVYITVPVFPVFDIGTENINSKHFRPVLEELLDLFVDLNIHG